MTSYLDLSDSALLTLVARVDGHSLGELFRRYATVVLVAAGWSDHSAADAERRTVEVFLDVWARPGAYLPGAESTRAHLARAAMHGADEQAVRLRTARLAGLEGWTYHDVAEVLARPAQHVAAVIRDELIALRGS